MCAEAICAGKVIDALGGTTAVARIFHVRDSAVSNWRIRGFPKSREHEVWLVCRRRGVAYRPTGTEIDVGNVTTHGDAPTDSSAIKRILLSAEVRKETLNERDKKITETKLSSTVDNSVSSAADDEGEAA